MFDSTEIGASYLEKHARHAFFGVLLKASSFGIYCILFILYLYMLRRRRTAETRILVFPLTVLFVLYITSEAIDITVQFLVIFPKDDPMIRYNLNVVGMGLYTVIDLLCQGILIYRCCVMWNHRLLFTIISSILASASFATGLAVFGGLVSAEFSDKDEQFMPSWWSSLWIASLIISMTVNFIVTGLLIFRISLLHKSITNTPGHIPRIGLGRVITGLAESGAVLFFFQASYLVTFCLGNAPFSLDSTPCAMAYGITPTLLYVHIALRNAVNPIDTNRLPTNLFFTDNATHLSTAPVAVGLDRSDERSQDASSSEEKNKQARLNTSHSVLTSHLCT